MLGTGAGKLSEIEDALERIKDTSYGGCEECGEPIAEDRLRALPFTRVCVECQSKNERELKIKGGGSRRNQASAFSNAEVRGRGF